MRNTFLLVFRVRRRRRPRKFRNTRAVKRCRKIMKANRPRLVMEEIKLQRKRWPVPDASGVWHRPALSLQHALFHYQSGAVGLPDFPTAFYGPGVSEFSWPSPTPDAED